MGLLRIKRTFPQVVSAENFAYIAGGFNVFDSAKRGVFRTKGLRVQSSSNRALLARPPDRSNEGKGRVFMRNHGPFTSVIPQQFPARDAINGNWRDVGSWRHRHLCFCRARAEFAIPLASGEGLAAFLGKISVPCTDLPSGSCPLARQVDIG